MRGSLLCVLVLFSAASTFAAGFSASIPPDERERLGLDRLTPEQVRALDAAVERYREQGARERADAAVSEYKQREQPRLIAKAVEEDRSTRKEGEQPIQSRIKGKFRGWTGGTLFELENGQVWRQTGTDTYVTRAIESPEVEVAKSAYGYYRLRLADGAWVNVKRVK